MRDRMWRVVLTLATAWTLLACGSGPLGAGSATFDAAFPAFGEIDALPVRVEDRTGLIEGIRVVPDADLAPGEGVQGIPGRPDLLGLTWLGGMCDEAVTIVVEQPPGGLLVRATTHEPSGCLLAGIYRALVLDLREPIDPAALQLEGLMPP